MSKFFYKFHLVLLSFLGIGFTTRFREFYVSIVALLVVWLLHDPEKEIVLLILIIFFISFFIIFIRLNPDFNNTDVLVFGRAVGLWTACLSPFVLFNWFWILICLAVYYLIFSLFKKVKFRRFIKYGVYIYLLREMMTGLTVLFVIQLLYTLFSLAPVIYWFLNE